MRHLERRRELHIAITIAVVLAESIGAYFFGSGIDHSVFRESTLGIHPEALLPPYAYWVLWPLMILPSRVSLAATVFISTSLMAYAGFRLTGSGLPALLSMAGFLSAETGQIDGILALGFMLGVHSFEEKKPLLLGGAVLLMGIKPQLGAVAGLWLLLHYRDWRSLVIPVLVAIATLLTDGVWPLDYLQSSGRESMLGGLHNISLWPAFGPLLLPLIVVPFWCSRGNPRRGILLSLLVSFMLMPYSNFFSMDLLFAVGLPVSLVPMSFIPLLPIWKGDLANWAFMSLQILPIAGLINEFLAGGNRCTDRLSKT